MAGKVGLPSLSALHTFSVAARHLSFTKAADELCVTQGAVSRQVLHLEASLKRPLFLRHPKGLSLTADGCKLAKVVHEGFEGIRRVSQEISGTHDELRVLVPTCLMRWSMPILIAFQVAHAEQVLSITTTISHRADSPKHDYDVAFVYDALDSHEDHRIGLFPERLMPVCAPSLARMGQAIEQPADLGRHMLLHARPDHADWTLWFQHMGCGGIETLHGMNFDTLDLSIHAAMAGYGIALGDQVVNAPDLANGSLICPIDAAVATGHGYFMSWRSDRPVVEQLRDEFFLPAALGALALQTGQRLAPSVDA